MNVRPFQVKDEAVLRDIYNSLGYAQFPFPDLTKSLTASVITDESDNAIMGAYMRLVPEGTLICPPGKEMHPLVKMRGITMLHENFRNELMRMGYTEAIASVPPQLQGYRRHLQRQLNWKESWPTYRVCDVSGWRRP